PEEVPGPGVHPALIGALVVTAVAIGVLGYVWLHRPPPAPPAQAAAKPSAPAPARTLKADPPLDVVIPPLDESDAVVRRLVSALSKYPAVMAWTETGGLIRNFTLVVSNIAEDHLPTKFLTMVRPKGAFTVITSGDKTYIDPSSYHRYDMYADAFAALDATGAARLYATVRPRVAEAYRELGYPDRDFDATLKAAIVELLATPVVDGQIPVARPQ